MIKRKAGKNAGTSSPDDNEEDEESWTFVGADEPDPDFMTKKLSEGLDGYGDTGPPGTGSSRPLGSQVLKAA